jgi:hypothetical protein
MASPSAFGLIDNGNRGFFNNRTGGQGADKKSIKELAYKAFIVAQEQNILVEAWLPETVMVDINATYEAPFAQGLGSIGALQGISEFARYIGLSMTTQAMTAQVWQGGAFIEFSMPLIFQAEDSAGNDVMVPIMNLMRLTMPKEPTAGGFLQAPGPRIDPKKLAQNGIDSFNDAFTLARDAANRVNSSQVNSPTDTSKTAVSRLSDFAASGYAKANEVAKTLSNRLVNSVSNNISLYIGQFQYFASVVITDVSPTYDVVLAADKNPLRATVNVNFRTFFIPTDQDIESMFPSAKSLESKSGGFQTAGGI